MKKLALALIATTLFLVIGCTKYLDGITDTKNWTLDWHPNFGLAVLNANISYKDLQAMIPADSNFSVSAQSIGNGDSILVMHANQSILSAFNDFFVLQDFTYSTPSPLPIVASSIQTIKIPLTNLINIKGLNTTTKIKSIKFAGGTINLNLNGTGIQNISKISATLGGVSSQEITPTNSEEVVVPIVLKDKTINVNTNDEIELAINLVVKTGVSPNNVNVNLNSENLDFTDIVINNFSYTSTAIKTDLNMNFFDKINSGNLGFKLEFPKGVNLVVTYNNQSDLLVTIPSITVAYTYKNGIPVPSKTITGIVDNKSQSFPLSNISNLLTNISFTLTPTITTNANPITLSKKTNMQLKGSVDIPLEVNIQNLDYEVNLSLPKITDNQILNALEELTIKTNSKNGFPVELTAKLVAVDDAGVAVPGSEINLENIVKGENTNSTNSITIDVIKKLVSTGKGKVILGIATHGANGQLGAGKFTTQDKLNLRLGLSIKANGKEILNQL